MIESFDEIIDKTGVATEKRQRLIFLNAFKFNPQLNLKLNGDILFSKSRASI